MAIKLKDIEGEFSKVIKEFKKDSKLILIEKTLGAQTWIDPTYTYIPSLDIDIHAGKYITIDFNKNCFTVDSSVYIIYNHVTKQEVYFELCTSLTRCVYNYCKRIKLNELSTKEIDNIDCFYCLNPESEDIEDNDLDDFDDFDDSVFLFKEIVDDD